MGRSSMDLPPGFAMAAPAPVPDESFNLDERDSRVVRELEEGEWRAGS